MGQANSSVDQTPDPNVIYGETISYGMKMVSSHAANEKQLKAIANITIKAADFINAINDFHSDDVAPEEVGEQLALKKLAIRAAQEAKMRAVQAITWK